MRLQTQSKSGAPKNTWDVVKELGVGGLYHGAGMTLARDVPSSAIFFACYAVLRQLYPDQSFLAGCLAAIPATIFGTPMDIIKTRLQVIQDYKSLSRRISEKYLRCCLHDKLMGIGKLWMMNC